MPIYNTPQRPSKRSDGWPRRHDIQLDTDPERLCRILVGLVESMGASTALTNAVVALDKARNFIADHVERIEESVPTSPEQDAPRATRSAAELLREVAAADPEAHNLALARGYGVGPEQDEQR